MLNISSYVRRMFLLILVFCALLTFSISLSVEREQSLSTKPVEGSVDSPLGVEMTDITRDCSESLGLVKTFTTDGISAPHWDCTNYTGFTDSYGHAVGGNCKGTVSFGGHVECECIPNVDPVTKKKYPTTQLGIQNIQLCVVDASLFEAD